MPKEPTKLLAHQAITVVKATRAQTDEQLLQILAGLPQLGPHPAQF